MEVSDVARSVEFLLCPFHRICHRGRAQQRLSGPDGKAAGFRIADGEGRAKAFAAVPFLVFAAPFIIMRNTIRGRIIEGRRVQFVAIATVIAGFWSMMSGTFVLMLLERTGVIA
jgi:hypothetical protein